MIPLNVPFDKKDAVKALAPGLVRWDSEGIYCGRKKSWFFYGDLDELPESLKEYVAIDHKTWVVAVPFPMREMASQVGARWDANEKVNYFVGAELPWQLQGLEAQPFSREKLIEDKLNGKKRRALPNDGVFVPRPHQEEAIREIRAAFEQGLPGFLLADDVGLGKTCSAWEANHRIAETLLKKAANADLRVLVVCPKNALPGWRSTIGHLGHGDHDVLTINYDQIKKLFDVPDLEPAKVKKGKKTKKVERKVKTLKGVAKFGEAHEFDLILWDESHYLCNLTSARTKLAFKLYEKAKFMVWMSATAGEDPLQMGYLAPLLAARTGNKTVNTKEFENWCKDMGLSVRRAQFGKWVWGMRESGEYDDNNKPILEIDPVQRKKDCALVHKLLFTRKNGALAAMRRVPKDIAGWPEINRIILPIELDEDQRAQYNLAWSQFCLETRGSKGTDSDMPLVLITRFRQKASMLRVPGTLDQCYDLLSNGKQVAISFEFLDPLREVEQKLNAQGIITAKITGENSNEREPERLRYQRGEATVCLFTAKDAISLHQGQKECGGNDVERAQIDHDIRWGAKAMHQVDGRSHRDGKFAQVYWMVATETIETDVAEKLLHKVESMGNIQGDDNKDMLELARQMLKQARH